MDLVLLAIAIRFTTPLLLAALGGLFSERAGVVNIALEGIMIFGALTAAVVAQQLEAPILAVDPTARLVWVPWLATFAAMVAGAFIGWIHAVVSIKYRADQVISGTAINLLALGAPAVVLLFLYNNTTDSKEVINVLPKWGITDTELMFSPLTYLALVLVPIVSYVLYRTPFGLRMRSVGEAPLAAASVGVNVAQIRYTAVIINLSANQGFIALAALIFGKWQPWNVLGAAFLFGAFKAIAIRLGGSDLLPPTIVEALPYLITVLVLAGFIGRSRAPKALGKPYP
jgi:general nucleoside transport system permease protein